MNNANTIFDPYFFQQNCRLAHILLPKTCRAVCLQLNYTTCRHFSDCSRLHQRENKNTNILTLRPNHYEENFDTDLLIQLIAQKHFTDLIFTHKTYYCQWGLLHNFEERLNSHFFRTNRSNIVNELHVDTSIPIQPTSLTLLNGNKVPINIDFLPAILLRFSN